MTTSKPEFLDAPASGRRTPLIVDHLDYSQRVLLRGNPIPWDDPTALSNLFNQAHGLLRPDVTLLDLGAYYRILARDPRLQDAMTARSRPGYALRVLLGDPSAGRAAATLVATVAGTTRLPLVLQIPSPRAWLAQTHPGTTEDLDADRVESAAMYVADWLRGFADVPVAALLLDERAAGGVPAVPADTYTPIGNVAVHYRWELGLRDDPSVSFGGRDGDVLGDDFWLGDHAAVPAASAAFRLTRLPESAVPETVLARLADLDREGVRSGAM
ncbi:hypothetical protein [Rhodococcus zopfii]|uniref:hypothetical protein n=1 Tax=Rhodococcus zopfii TaxID=43772 RepID=UPI0009345D65|nr:hypothetical protein [Rhodococcus zopfii]